MRSFYPSSPSIYLFGINKTSRILKIKWRGYQNSAVAAERVFEAVYNLCYDVHTLEEQLPRGEGHEQYACTPWEGPQSSACWGISVLIMWYKGRPSYLNYH